MKGFTIMHDMGILEQDREIFEAHVDPKHRDIVINGYGISKAHAKQMRDWLTKAIRETGRKKGRRMKTDGEGK